MLSLEELREISSINPNDEYYVSLYLNVDPVTNPRGEYIITFRNMLSELQENLDKDVKKEVARDLEELDWYFIGTQRFKKALCILSSKEKDFWREYHLNVPVKSQIVVEKTPYIEPLLDIMDNYQRYLALLVSKDSARIFVVQMGEILEYGEIETPGVIGRHKKGGWFALSEDRYARHRDVHVGIHLKEVVKELGEFMEREKVKLVLVGGPQETLAMAVGELPHEIKDKVIGNFSAGMYENPAEILSRLDPIIREHERKKEAEAIEELITRVNKNKQAVLGISDVLLMLEEGRVQELIVDEGLRQSGFLCHNCRALSMEPGRCRYCGNPLEEVNYFTDLVMEKAAQLGGKIEVVPDNERLRKSGGIGAFLRF
jgi:peptide chain release factor subunit 1